MKSTLVTSMKCANTWKCALRWNGLLISMFFENLSHVPWTSFGNIIRKIMNWFLSLKFKNMFLLPLKNSYLYFSEPIKLFVESPCNVLDMVFTSILLIRNVPTRLLVNFNKAGLFDRSNLCGGQCDILFILQEELISNINITICNC